MLKGSAFAQSVIDSEVLLSEVLKKIYRTANSILSSHPLYEYFEQYLGGYLIIMDPDGTVLSAEDDEALNLQQIIGYIHPLDRDRYYQNALEKAQSLQENHHFRSYDALSEDAGAIKISNGTIFSYSGFEFLRLKDNTEYDSYEDIFETINLYSLLTSDFFNTKIKDVLNPHRYSFGDETQHEENVLREEILFSLTNEELIDIATKICTTGLQYNFSLLNEIFISKVLLECGLVDMDFTEKLIKTGNTQFSAC